MSVHALSWAWRQEVGDPAAKLLLMKLADQANDAGECWPSQRTLARECEMSRRTVQRKLEILYASGFVRSEPRARNDGGDTSLVYHVGIQAVTEQASDDHAFAPVRQIVQGAHDSGDAPPAPLVTHHEPSEEPTPAASTSTRDGREQRRVRRMVERSLSRAERAC